VVKPSFLSKFLVKSRFLSKFVVKSRLLSKFVVNSRFGVVVVRLCGGGVVSSGFWNGGGV